MEQSPLEKLLGHTQPSTTFEFKEEEFRSRVVHVLSGSQSTYTRPSTGEVRKIAILQCQDVTHVQELDELCNHDGEIFGVVFRVDLEGKQISVLRYSSADATTYMRIIGTL